MKCQCLSHTFCEAWHRGSKVMSLFSILLYVHIEVFQSSSKVFKWFSLCFGLSFVTKGVYLSQWMIALSSLFLTSKPIFQNRYMQFTTSFWAVWIMGLPKQLKSRSFWGPLTKALSWTHRGLYSPMAPSIIFRFSSLVTCIPLHYILYWSKPLLNECNFPGLQLKQHITNNSPISSTQKLI